MSVPNACYYFPPNDGAHYKCNECGKYYEADYVIRILLPDNSQKLGVTCLDCVDSEWLKIAENLQKEHN